MCPLRRLKNTHWCQLNWSILPLEYDKNGLNRDSNPGPLAPKARIIPLDHWAAVLHVAVQWYILIMKFIDHIELPMASKRDHNMAFISARHDPLLYNYSCILTSPWWRCNGKTYIDVSLLDPSGWVKKLTKTGSTGIRTRGLSHPKRESYH